MFIVSLTFLMVIPMFSQAKLPITDCDSIKPISELQNDELQAVLDKEINSNPVWKGLVTKELMSISIVDLNDINNIKYAGINDDNMMYAASLPKIAILLAAVDAIEKGELTDTREVRNDLRLMISKSNNKTSTRMIDRLG